MVQVSVWSVKTLYIKELACQAVKVLKSKNFELDPIRDGSNKIYFSAFTKSIRKRVETVMNNVKEHAKDQMLMIALNALMSKTANSV